MAHFPLSTLLVLIVSYTVATPSLARPQENRISTSKLTIQGMQSNSIAHETTNVAAEGLDFAGVIHSSPAHPMPSYHQNAAPAPLPEFPTLGPPIVWSFPAAPLPALEAPPPKDMPALPRTRGKYGAPRPCQGGRHHTRLPYRPPAVPQVAAEPAIWPGPLEAPETAPEPTAGGPSAPPY